MGHRRRRQLSFDDEPEAGAFQFRLMFALIAGCLRECHRAPSPAAPRERTPTMRRQIIHKTLLAAPPDDHVSARRTDARCQRTARSPRARIETSTSTIEPQLKAQVP